MVIIHAYTHPRKRKDANCAACKFAEPTRTLNGEKALLCTERMYDDVTFKCYLPREEKSDENS